MDSRTETEKFFEHLTGWSFSALKNKTLGMTEISQESSQFSRLGLMQEGSKCYQIDAIDAQAKRPFTIQFCKGEKGVSQILIVAI